MGLDLILSILVVIAAVLIITVVRRWVAAPRHDVERYRQIEQLWDERERIRGHIATHSLTHWEKAQLQSRVDEINNELHTLGVPRDSLS